MTEGKEDQKQTGSEIKTFPIPFSLGKSKDSISLSKSISTNPSKQEIINKAINLHLKGNITEAAKCYQYCIDNGLTDHRVFSNYGAILQDLGRLKEAEKLYYKAIEIKSNSAEAHSNLGNILTDLGKLKEAEVSTRKAIELKPNFADAHNNLGRILHDTGKLSEAEISYSKAIELKSNFDNAYINRGRLYSDQGKFDKALIDSDSCNTKISRAFSLENLYALGRIEEIYERIEKASELYDRDIRLAAFSSFIEANEKKETSNNFCRNPLSFIHFSNLKSHLKNHPEFIKNIINDLAEVKTIWEPPKKATHNGFQTPTHINLFSNSSENISYLKSIILNELDFYYMKFQKEDCSYIQKWPSNKHLKAWHVILKKQGYQDAHIHPSGWLSGVIYLKVVPSLGKDEGAIEFSLNGARYSNINSPKLMHHPEAGDMVFFPSSLHHRTIPFSTNSDRIVIAFDLMPN